MIIWNPWHGCHKVSEGCQHCYMYFLDGKRGIDTSKIYRTENVSKANGEHKARFNAIPSAGNFAESNFNLSVQRRRDGRFKLPSGMRLYVGPSTDFFVEDAAEWQEEAWQIMRQAPHPAWMELTNNSFRSEDSPEACLELIGKKD